MENKPVMQDNNSTIGGITLAISAMQQGDRKTAFSALMASAIAGTLKREQVEIDSNASARSIPCQPYSDSPQRFGMSVPVEEQKERNAARQSGMAL